MMAPSNKAIGTIMSILDDLLGNTAADASRSAAADTYGKQNTAIQNLLGYGKSYADAYKTLGQSYDPWIQTGQTANTQLQNLLADPSSVSSLPGYQFQLGQGTKAIDGAAAATGKLFSGSNGKALESYGQNLASTTYNQQLQNLLGVSNQGLGAQQSQNSTIGTGLTGQLGTQTGAYNGQMTAAGTIGQGDVAAASAQAKGAQSLLGAATSLAGSALGGGSFGNIGNLLGFGSTPDYGQTSNKQIGNYTMPIFGRSA